MEKQLVNFQEKMVIELDNLKSIIGSYQNNSQRIQQNMNNIKAIYESKLNDLRPQIMVYGIYNAGKSSIINAILGEEKAKVDDIPTTDTIDYYQWNGYEIADTPGVCAPIEHENVTIEHLKKADIVLFVISTTGSNEKEENYIRMKDISAAGKKIIVVLNDKQGQLGKDEVNLSKIKMKVIDNMKSIGIKDNYYVVVVNASRAKKGRIEGKEKLVESSNFKELEQVMMAELKRTSSFDIMRSAIYEIGRSLEEIILELDNGEEYEEIKKINGIFAVLKEQKINIRQQINEYIKNKTNRMGKILPDFIWNKRDDQDAINCIVQGEIEKLTKSVQREMELYIKGMEEVLSIEIESLLKELYKIDLELNTPIVVNQSDPYDVYEVYEPSADDVVLETKQDRREQITKLMFIAREMYEIYSKNKSAKFLDMDLIAKAVPTIGKFIAPDVAKTITAKIAETAIGSILAANVAGKVMTGTLARAIPYVGLILTGIMVWQALRGDNNEGARMEAEAKARNEHEQKRAEAELQAQYDLREKCMYMAEDMAEELNHAMNNVIREVVGDIEEVFKAQLEESNNIINVRANDIIALREIHNNYDVIRLNLGEK